MSLLLETTAAAPVVPTFFVGVLALLILLAALGWVVGMGSGRPNSK